MKNNSSPAMTKALQLWRPSRTSNEMSIIPFSTRSFTSSGFTLPDDWVVEEKARTTGNTAGVIDKYYYEPETGRKFRSLISVRKHLREEQGHTPRSLKSRNLVVFKKRTDNNWEMARKTPRTTPFELPNGWFVKETIRQSGRSKGRVDKYYCEPGTGRIFRSRFDVQRYLAELEDNGTMPESPRLASRVEMSKKGSHQEEEMAIVAYKTPRTIPIELPDGWIVKETIRKSGSSVGKIDRYYSEPGTGRVFRSMVDVQRYLAEIEEETTVPKRMKPISHIKMLTSDEKELNYESKTVCLANTTSSVSAFELPDDTLLKEIVGRSGSPVGRTKRASHNSIRKKSVSPCKVKAAAFDFSKPPVKIKWVLSGPGGDKWNPVMGGSMVPESVKQQWEQTFIFSVNHKNLNAARSQSMH